MSLSDECRLHETSQLSTRVTNMEQFLKAAQDQDWVLVARLGISLIRDGNAPLAVFSMTFDAYYHRNDVSAAEAIILDALVRFPDAVELQCKEARLAMMKQDYALAARLWSALRGNYPNVEEFYKSGAFCLQQIERFDEARRVLELGTVNMPSSADLWVDYLKLLLFLDDLESAFLEWEQRSAAYLHHEAARIIGAEVLFAKGDLATAQGLLATSTDNEAPARNAVEEHDEELSEEHYKDILMQFESLGGRLQGCEFGLLQRAFGAEPLGLLRWADAVPGNLISALECGFHGFGEPDTTILKAPPRPGADWMTDDACFGFTMHTFQMLADTPENRHSLFRSTCRRYQFLKTKLLEDLTAGEKLFVYKLSTEILDDETLGSLHRAIRRYGPSTLLYVRHADSDHMPGSVEWREPGLLVGYIERFSHALGPCGDYLGAATDCWLPLIRRAYEMWRQSQQAGAASATYAA